MTAGSEQMVPHDATPELDIAHPARGGVEMDPGELANPSEPGHAEKKRSPVGCLGCFFATTGGCLAMLVGGLLAVVLMAPSMLGSVIGNLAASAWSDQIEGHVTIDQIALSWFGPQRFENVRVHDLDGEILHLSCRVPSLLSMIEVANDRWEVDLEVFGGVVEFDEEGRSNLAQMFAPDGESMVQVSGPQHSSKLGFLQAFSYRIGITIDSLQLRRAGAPLTEISSGFLRWDHEPYESSTLEGQVNFGDGPRAGSVQLGAKIDWANVLPTRDQVGEADLVGLRWSSVQGELDGERVPCAAFGLLLDHQRLARALGPELGFTASLDGVDDQSVALSFDVSGGSGTPLRGSLELASPTPQAGAADAPVTYSASAELQFPMLLVEGLWQQVDELVGVFGELGEATFGGPVTADGFSLEAGELEFELSAPGRAGVLTGVYADAALRSREGVSSRFELPLTDRVRERFLGRILPWLTVQSLPADAPPAQLVVDDFHVPVGSGTQPLSASIVLDLGTVPYRLTPGFALGLGLQGAALESSSADLPPMTINLGRELVRYRAIELLIGGRPCVFDGVFDAREQTLSLQAVLAAEFIPKLGLDSGTLPVVITGTLGEPQLSYSEEVIRDAIQETPDGVFGDR